MFARNPFRLVALGIIVVLLGVTAGCGAQTRKAAHMARGERYLAAQNYQKASVEFQNVLQIDPKDARARYELGTSEEKIGHLTQAVQAYQAAIQVAPQQDYPESAIALAKLMVTNGVPDQALILLKVALQKHPDQPDLLVMRAVARVQQKDILEGAKDAERAVLLAPLNENAIGALAGIYKAEGQQLKAQMLLEHAAREIPDSPDLHFLLAQIYADAAHDADAEAQYQRVIDLRPKETSDRIRLAQFYVRAKRPDAAETVLRRAVRDFPNERALKLSLVDFLAAQRTPGTAVQELTKMIAAAPEDRDLQLALARLYRQTGAMPQAEAAYRTVIQQEGTSPLGLQARTQLAGVRLGQNDLDAALALTKEVLAQNPRDNDALLIRGNAELARNDPRSAVGNLRTALRDQPDNPAVLSALVRAHLANGEPLIAEEVLRQAVEANPKNPALERDLAQLLTRLGKSEDAAAVIATAVMQYPDNPDLLDTQFRIAMTAKDIPRAKLAADAIVAKQPKLALGYMYQGVVAEAEKRFEDALGCYTAAANLQPDTVEALEAEVRVLAQINRLPEALKRLDVAAARFPKDALPLDVKGELLVQSRRFADAKQAFRQAMERSPTWWPPYRGMAKAQLLGNEDLATIIEGLRHAKAVVARSEGLTEVLADLLVRAGKPDEAIAEYEESLRKNPKSDVTANNLAMLLVTYRTDAPSLAQARDLAAQFADSPSLSFRDTYGWVLYKRGQAAAALPVFARIVAEAPRALVARYHLGMAQALAGNPAEARDNLMQVVDSGQRFPGLNEAKLTLERLNKPAADASPRT